MMLLLAALIGILIISNRYGLMRDLDRWIVRHAMTTVSTLAGYDNIVFSINLSGQSAADPTPVDVITEQYQIHQVNPANLCFEVTETAAISNYDNAVELIQAIQSLGSREALDDSGSGLSSFGYLKTLPVDILKIDGQFIRELANCPIDRAMVRAIQVVADSMNLTTVAEYVEDRKLSTKTSHQFTNISTFFKRAKSQIEQSKLVGFS